MSTARLVVRFGPPDPDAPDFADFNRSLEDCSLAAGDLLYLVRTTLRQRQLERHLLAQTSGFFESPISTLNQVIRRLFRRLSLPVRVISESEKLSLLHGVVLSHRGRPDFQAVGSLPYLSQFISFVKQQQVDTREMLLLRCRSARGGTLQPIDLELADLFVTYQDRLSTLGLEDWDGVLTKVFQGLLTGSIEPSLGRRLVLEGFGLDLKPLERAILKLFVLQFGEVVVRTFELIDPASEEALERFGFLGVAPVAWESQGTQMRGRCKVEKQVWGSPSEECSRLAQFIAGLRESSSPELRFSEVVVAYSNDDYRALIEDNLKLWGIPFCQVAGETAISGVLLPTLRRYLDWAEADFGAELFFNLAQGTPVRLHGLTVEHLGRLEAACRSAGLIRNTASWPEELSHFLGKSEGIQGGSTDESLIPAAEQLCELVAALRFEKEHRLPLNDWWNLVRSRMARLIPWEAFTESAHCLARGEIDALARFSENLVPESEWDDENTLSWEAFRDRWSLVASSLKLPVDLAGDTVWLGRPDQFRYFECKVLIWLGVTDEDFPPPPPPHVLFDEVASREWGFPDWKSRVGECRSLLRLLPAGAKTRVVFSLPSYHNGVAVIPSPLLEEVDLVENIVPNSPAPKPVPRALTRDVARHVLRARTIESTRRKIIESEYLGYLKTAPVRTRHQDRLMRSGALTPTGLADYMRCGFRYFLRRMVGIQPDRPGDGRQADPGELGRILHAVLFEFVRDTSPPGRAVSRQSWIANEKQRMAGVLRRELGRLAHYPWSDHLIWQHKIKTLTSGLDGEYGPLGPLARFVEQQWDQLQTNQVLGLEEMIGPVSLGVTRIGVPPEKIVPITVRAKIDRLERQPKGLQVIDYKTGEDPRPFVNAGWGLQLPLYAWLVDRTFAEPVVGASFYTLQSPSEVRKWELGDNHDPSLLKNLVEYYAGLALELGRCLFEGRFPTTVLDRRSAGCQSCEFRLACRYDSLRARQVEASGSFPSPTALVRRGTWVGPKTKSEEEAL